MSTQVSLNFDVTRNKHGGARNSERANDRIHSLKPSLRNRVLEHIRANDASGSTSHEIAAALNKPIHCISGRISELKRDAFVIDIGEDRNGAAILRATELK